MTTETILRPIPIGLDLGSGYDVYYNYFYDYYYDWFYYSDYVPFEEFTGYDQHIYSSAGDFTVRSTIDYEGPDVVWTARRTKRSRPLRSKLWPLRCPRSMRSLASRPRLSVW